MSRVGKNPIPLPKDLVFNQVGQLLTFKGKLGEESFKLPDALKCEKKDDFLSFSLISTFSKDKPLWGTVQRSVFSIIKGLTEGFSIRLTLVGVGYKAALSGDHLKLNLGFSHEIMYKIPFGIIIKCDSPTSLLISGYSKQKVGQVAAEIRKFRKPEPYKGKGIIREGEFVVRKEGKKK